MRRQLALALLLAATGAGGLAGQEKPERARDIGIALDGVPGPLDAITDVAGVEVGHVTIVRGEGRLRVGTGPVRTGITAVFPRGPRNLAPVFAGWFSLNGNGEMTGTAWINDYALLLYPILLTNTNSVGTVRDAVIEWGRTRITDDAFNCCLPVVAETWDGDLSDIYGFHVTRQHVFQVLERAQGGPVPEGSVGGGTGMICLGFKGGIGTASRRLAPNQGGYTVGALVQCNFGERRLLRIAGAPVGREIPDLQPCYEGADLDSARAAHRCPTGGAGRRGDQGSIIVVLATDAPLLPHQLRRTRGGRPWASAGWAGSPGPARATCSSPSPPSTPAPRDPTAPRRSGCCRTSGSTRSTRPRCRRRRRRSSMPCSPPAPCAGRTAWWFLHYRTTA